MKKMTMKIVISLAIGLWCGLLYGQETGPLPLNDLMTLDALVSHLSADNIFYPEKRMQESPQVYTLQILRSRDMQKNQLKTADISARVIRQFEKWQSTFLKAATIRHFTVEKLMAFKDVVLFETRRSSDELVFSWESDLLFWANQEDKKFFCWDTGTCFVLCIPVSPPAPLTQTALRQWLQELLLSYTNFPESLLNDGEFDAKEERQLWRGTFMEPGRKIRNWQSRIEWIVGADFVCFFFRESDEPPRMRKRPGDVNRF